MMREDFLERTRYVSVVQIPATYKHWQVILVRQSGNIGEFAPVRIGV
jgi:hypothetical protein